MQNRYGEFVESVQDDVVCVTRHGRPLFWAVSDRQVRSDDPSLLVGRLLLLNGQLRQQKGIEQGVSKPKLSDFLATEIDPVVNMDAITPEAMTQFVHANRR